MGYGDAWLAGGVGHVAQALVTTGILKKGNVLMEWPDGKQRCCWANPANPRYVAYHDDEWGVPVHDDDRLFEMLVLECFQAGLSWECILNKREAFRRAFDGFDPATRWSTWV